MNRRQMLGSLGALLVPTWAFRPVKRSIPLHEFAANDWQVARFDMDKPFVQELGSRLFGYATDSKIILKVDATEVNQGDEQGRIPPAYNIEWDRIDALRGWSPWPKKMHLTDRDDHPEEYGRWIQKVGSLCIDTQYDDKIRKHLGNVEFAILPDTRRADMDRRVIGDAVAFRFDGGTGLLMSMNVDPAEFKSWRRDA